MPSPSEHGTIPPDPSVSKTYSFVSLPGNAVRKRPRRRYDEIERLYHCSWPDCPKNFATLNHLNAHIVMQRHGNKRTAAEFKELRKQWRKAKKEETERLAQLGRVGERYAVRSEHGTLQYPPQPYDRPPRSYSYGRQQLYGPGVPGPEMDHQMAVGDAPARYPLGADTSMRPQPLQPQRGYSISDPAHSLYPIAPTTPVPSTWSDHPTQDEGGTSPKPSSTPGHSYLLAQAVYDNERERQAQPWAPPSHATSLRPVPYEVSSSYAQPHPQQRLSAVLDHEYEEYEEDEEDDEYDGMQQFWTKQEQQEQEQARELRLQQH